MRILCIGRIAGSIDVPSDEAIAAMRQYCLPGAGNIANLAYYRAQPDKPTVGAHPQRRILSQSTGDPSSHSGGSPHLPEGA